MAFQTHQECARVEPASGYGHGRPPKPEIDGREVRPHLCTRTASARVRICTCEGVARDAVVKPFSWAITVGIVAPVFYFADPERPLITPALDGRVVLQ